MFIHLNFHCSSLDRGTSSGYGFYFPGTLNKQVYWRQLIQVLRKFGFLGVTRLFPGSTLVFFSTISLSYIPSQSVPSSFFVPLTSSPPSSLLYLCDTIGVCCSMPLWSSVDRNRNVSLPPSVQSKGEHKK